MPHRLLVAAAGLTSAAALCACLGNDPGPPDSPPRFPLPYDSIQAFLGDTLRYTMYAQDPEGGPLRFELLPDTLTGMRLNGNTLVWAPAKSDRGYKSLRVIVHDSRNLADTLPLTIEVRKHAFDWRASHPVQASLLHGRHMGEAGGTRYFLFVGEGLDDPAQVLGVGPDGSLRSRITPARAARTQLTDGILLGKDDFAFVGYYDGPGGGRGYVLRTGLDGKLRADNVIGQGAISGCRRVTAWDDGTLAIGGSQGANGHSFWYVHADRDGVPIAEKTYPLTFGDEIHALLRIGPEEILLAGFSQRAGGGGQGRILSVTPEGDTNWEAFLPGIYSVESLSRFGNGDLLATGQFERSGKAIRASSTGSELKAWSFPDTTAPFHNVSCGFSATFPTGEALISCDLREELLGIIRLEAGSDDGDWIKGLNSSKGDNGLLWAAKVGDTAYTMAALASPSPVADSLQVFQVDTTGNQ